MGEFTGLYDSDGTPIYEGDEVEYFDRFYCNGGRYYEENSSWVSTMPEGFITRARAAGCTLEYRYMDGEEEECIEMRRPLRGIVKWNPEVVTYEPLVTFYDDYSNNCFWVVINDQKDKDKYSYCRVIKPPADGLREN